MKRPLLVQVLSTILLLAAWVVDLLTPQLFVAAILLNGPIALSGLALNTRFTYALVIAAEIANIIAGYVNAAQAHNHWDSLAVGDRLLSAASFLLVGFLTVRAQEYAREAGSATERAQFAADERSLRRAIDAMRSSLNVDLVLRAIAREARVLFDAQQAILIVRRTPLGPPDLYTIARNSQDPSLERRALDSTTTSLMQRITGEAAVIFAREDDPVARMALEERSAQAMAAIRIFASEYEVVLCLFGESFARDTERVLRAYASAASVALEQAWLFMQLAYRNEEIEHRNNVIRDIVYALAHDLRTPLTAAHTTMQQALDGAYGELPERYREILRISLASNADLRRLAETLLLVARLESGEGSTLREQVDAGAQAERVVQELSPIAQAKSVRLAVYASPGSVVLGDSSEIRRAVSNLVANAIEATPESGSVVVRVVRDRDDINIEVEDDGFGVPQDRRAQLFQRFSSDSRTPGGGSGLGLYIVRLIAEKLGGHASYRQRDSRGSIFVLRLPAA